MNSSELRYISNEQGDLTAVIVPIAVWREISAELETQHLLKSDVMQRRLLEAKSRSGGVTLEEVLEQLGVDEVGSE